MMKLASSGAKSVSCLMYSKAMTVEQRRLEINHDLVSKAGKDNKTAVKKTAARASNRRAKLIRRTILCSSAVQTSIAAETTGTKEFPQSSENFEGSLEIPIPKIRTNIWRRQI